MPAMNLATQRRLGKFNKTPDMLTYPGHIYGNTHRPFVGRRPTPTQEGFFGLGSTANGDGKLHYYGNGPGQSDLPMHGFYGIGSADLEYQAANMLIDGASTHQPTHMDNPGMYGVQDYFTRQNMIYGGVGIVALMALGVIKKPKFLKKSRK